MFCELGASGLQAYWTVISVVFGLLVLNSLGCFFGLRWKKRRAQTGSHIHLFFYSILELSSLSVIRIFWLLNLILKRLFWCMMQLSAQTLTLSSSLHALLSICLYCLISFSSFSAQACTSHHIDPSKLSLLCFIHIFYLICYLYFFPRSLCLSLSICSNCQDVHLNLLFFIPHLCQPPVLYIGFSQLLLSELFLLQSIWVFTV